MVREFQTSIVDYFDQWHISKGVVKKMLGASKKLRDPKESAKFI
jgi:hypothetical protein